MSENLPATQGQRAPTPYQRMQNDGAIAATAGMNVGAVAIEQQRAIADAKAKRILAREYRRNTLQATQDVREVCRIPEFAQIAFYSVPRGGETVTGDSIRMAEELARCWGNIDYGHLELSRNHEKSEVKVFATDLETGAECSRQLTVMHVIDTKYGPKPCRGQKDIDDLINNKASKQRRGVILAVLPQWLREIAREECRKTLAGDNTVPLAARVRKMVDAFSTYGVSVDLLEKKLGHSLEKATADDMVLLTGVYNALRDGDAVSEHFDHAESEAAAEATGASITAQAKANAASTPAAAPKASDPAATPSPAPAPAARQRRAPAPAPTAAPAAAPDADDPPESSAAGNVSNQAASEPPAADDNDPGPGPSDGPGQDEDPF